MDLCLKRVAIRVLTALLLLPLLLFAGCDEEAAVQYDEDTVASFTTALANMDFETAYTYFWKYAGCCDKECFAEDYKNIADTLGITDITLKNVRVESSGDTDNFLLRYTAALLTDAAGEIQSDCSTHIVVEDGQTFIQYSRSLLLSGYEEGDRLVISPIAGLRGEILTSDGETVAENNYSDTVYVFPSRIQSIDSVLTQIAGIVELSQKDAEKAKKSFETAVEKNYAVSVVSAYPHDSIDSETEARLAEIEGVEVDRVSLTYQRFYPYKYSFSHITGYANTPNENQQKELKEGDYASLSVYGKEGLEKSCNSELLAKDGLLVSITDSDYNTKEILYQRDALDGQDVVLTIDSELQERCYYALHQFLSVDQTGVAIILDYSTGAVKGMSSFPSYDPNMFSFAVSDDAYAQLTSDESSQPLYPRATLGLYPPGSIIKPFVAAAALEDGTITKNTEFPYSIVNNNWLPNGWTGKGISRSYDSGTPLVLKNALSKSDNIYFSWVGMQMGSDALLNCLKKIGIGSRMDFDIPLASSNLINEGTELKESMLADMAIGHGEILITPLQMSAIYTAFTNGGTVLQPYIISGMYDTLDGEYTQVYSKEKSVLYENALSSSAVSTVREGLRAVVTEGTAKSIDQENRKMFAKTGTAIKDEFSDQRISWICAWVEDEEEKNLVLVMVDGPQEQDTVKFNIAKLLLANR